VSSIPNTGNNSGMHIPVEYRPGFFEKFNTYNMEFTRLSPDSLSLWEDAHDEAEAHSLLLVSTNSRIPEI